MPSRRTGAWTSSLILSPVVLSALAAAATGQDRPPRRPPEPFGVFVYAIEPADGAMKVQLEEALPMIRERIERRRSWFRLVDSRKAADVMLGIIHYRQGHPADLLVTGARLSEAMHDCWAAEYHYVDAVAVAGEARAALSGLDYRCVDVGPSLRNAAGHLAEELERFARANYGALSRVKVPANEKRPGETTK